MFTDIVGSSEVAVELGDKRWRKLQSLHHAEVRRQLRRGRGHEVDTAGDGFFATFETPAEAVRCAKAIVDGVRELGLEVRAGLHFGEMELTGEKVGGIAVTTAARVSALAGPGQVLVTSTVADLVGGSGLEFSDFGSRELKGVPGDWRLLALSRIDGEPLASPLDANEAARRRIEASPPDVTGARRIRLLPIALVGALVVGTSVLVLSRRGAQSAAPADSPTSALGGTLVEVLDATSGEVVQPVSVDGVDAGEIVFTDRSPGGQSFAWVVSSFEAGTPERQELTKIDRSDGAIVNTYEGMACIKIATCIASDGQAVWYPKFLRLDKVTFSYRAGLASTPVDGKVKTRRLGQGSQGVFTSVVSWGGSVWTGDSSTGEVYRTSPTTRKVTHFKVGNAADLLAFGNGALWVVDILGSVLREVNPSTGNVMQTGSLSGVPSAITWGGGYLWVANKSENTLQRIKPGHTSWQITTIPVGLTPIAITYAAGVLWVANAGDGTLWKLDTNGNPIGTFQVDGEPLAIAVIDDRVWMSFNCPSC